MSDKEKDEVEAEGGAADGDDVDANKKVKKKFEGEPGA